jgi:hypothetical protein
MTSLPSSISSSESRRFLRAFGLGAAILLGGLATISIASYRYGLIDVASRFIYDYQVAKIEDADEMNLVFVGDSSLGSAINADLFSELAGSPSASLALTGTYGVGASFNMIRQANDQHDVRTAVVMQGLNTMTRPYVVAGYFFTTTDLKLSELSPVEIAKLYLNYRTAKETLQQVMRHGFLREPPEMEGGYTKQRARRPDHRAGPDDEVVNNPLLPGMVASPEIEFIERIAEYCESESIRCVYAHGPIYDGYCKAAAPYIESLNQAITGAGLEVVEGTPPCVPLDELGDQVDHVAPPMRESYTRWYYERLRPYLE